MNGDTMFTFVFSCSFKKLWKIAQQQRVSISFHNEEQCGKQLTPHFPKIYGNACGNTSRNSLLFFPHKTPKPTKPWVNPSTVTTKWFDCQEAGKTKSSGDLLIKILRASESLGSTCYKGRSSFSKLWMQFQPQDYSCLNIGTCARLPGNG